MNTTVILMAYGSPTTMEEVPEYLREIYEGREVPEYAMKENTEKYRMVNGVSPSNAIIDSVVEKLKRRMSAVQETSVVLGNKHWKPFLKDVVSQMKADPPERIIGIPLFPFPSTNVLNSYLGPLREALQSNGLDPVVKMVNGLDLDLLADIWARIIDRNRPAENEALLFDAHSLPTFRNPEPEYDAAFSELSAKIAQRLSFHGYFRGYQSVGKYGKSWLGPTIYETFREIRKNYGSIVAAPIGFLYEHLEVLYDLDLEFGHETVIKSGTGYRRTILPDDSEDMVNLLEKVIIRAMEDHE